MKNIFVNNMINAMKGVLNEDLLLELRDILFINLNGCTISKDIADLVVYDGDADLKAVNMFFIAKTIEGFSEKSLEYYKGRIGAFLRKVNQKLKDIGTDHVRYYLAVRSRTDKVSNVTLNNERRVLNSFFTWLQAEGYIDKNPMLRIKNIKEGYRIKEPFSEYEIEALRENCSTLRDRAVIELLYSTGVRISELTSINWDDIDFSLASVKVIGKGNKERCVYLNAKSKYALRKYLDDRNDEDSALFVMDYKPFSRLSNTGIANMLNKLGTASKVNNVHAHRFRRTAATTALNRGMPIDQVQQMLGHSKIETTTIYAVADKENVKSSHKKFLS